MSHSTTPLQEHVRSQLADLRPSFEKILAPYTYFKIGGPAEVFFALAHQNDVVRVVKFCHDQHCPLTILSGGSNVIVADDGIRGIVLHLENETMQILDAPLRDGKKIVEIGAGAKTALAVRFTIDQGLTGLEYFLGVPGQLGGAIYNNAHYLTDLIGKHVHQVTVIRPDGSIVTLSQTECTFAYDSSVFQNTHDLIWSVQFALLPGTKERSLELVKEATLYRAKTQPLGDPSSGCYFRNTPNTPKLKMLFPQFAERSEVPTGFLIDQAGLKGERVGDIEVSQKHAAFFINRGQGTSRDVEALAARVITKVREQFDVELHPEVFFLGRK